MEIVLVEPEIPHNTGCAARLAAATGVPLHLVEPLGFSLDDRRVRRSGLDYWPRVRPRVWPDWRSFVDALPELGEPYLLSPRTPRPYWSIQFPDRVVLLFGRESTGLPEPLRARFPDRLIGIPMRDDGLRALNLATTVGVAGFEVMRQWSARGGP